MLRMNVFYIHLYKKSALEVFIDIYREVPWRSRYVGTPVVYPLPVTSPGRQDTAGSVFVHQHNVLEV